MYMRAYACASTYARTIAESVCANMRRLARRATVLRGSSTQSSSLPDAALCREASSTPGCAGRPVAQAPGICRVIAGFLCAHV